jgi:hypothetical protein
MAFNDDKKNIALIFLINSNLSWNYNRPVKKLDIDNKWEQNFTKLMKGDLKMKKVTIIFITVVLLVSVTIPCFGGPTDPPPDKPLHETTDQSKDL